MKNGLQLKLSQHLALTPQLQQSIRLLQLSTLELNQELESFLMENPLLERTEGWNEDTPIAVGGVLQPPNTGLTSPTDQDSVEQSSENEHWTSADIDFSDPSVNWKEGGEDYDYSPQIAATPSLIDHLISQLRLSNLSERDYAICALLLSHLDEEGYLSASLEEILDQEINAAHETELQELEIEELQIALKMLQSLEPIGVAARSLSECLCIQLNALPEQQQTRKLAITIARSHLQLLANHDFPRLKKILGCQDEALKAAQLLIGQCNPHPAADFIPSEARYVIPDVIVRKNRNQWTASLNPDAIPKLRVHRVYADMLNKDRGHSGHLSAQLQEARWLIKNVQQRFDTILRVSEAIVERQRHFFEHGEVAMRPLVLREIADTVGMHESTVSRVTTQKYMLTPRGIFELKYFFSSHVGTDSGGAASSTAIRALIKQLISAEDCRKPLSDSRLSDILAQQGIVVARRTVAKYREAMQIHPASQRKSL
jgi:RNA polymerase sigma-54 factor